MKVNKETNRKYKLRKEARGRRKKQQQKECINLISKSYAENYTLNTQLLLISSAFAHYYFDANLSICF